MNSDKNNFQSAVKPSSIKNLFGESSAPANPPKI